MPKLCMQLLMLLLLLLLLVMGVSSIPIGPALKIPCADGNGEYTEDNKCNRIADCLDGTDEKDCADNHVYYPSSYFQKDRLLNGRNDNTITAPSEDEKKRALAYVENLSYTPQIHPHSTQTQYFQGDIILESIEELDEILSIPQGLSRTKRVAPHVHPDQLWPGGRIPFRISTEFTAEERYLVIGAIKIINKITPCLNLVYSETNEHYVHILKGHQGCSSVVGKRGNDGGQDLHLGPKCLYSNENLGGSIGSVIHELMHAAGFWHEQCRYDRDMHVHIINENIKNGSEHAFDKHDEALHLDLPYDFTSLMHSSDTAFSKDNHTKRTIQAIDGNIEINGQRTHIEPLDELGLRLLYRCDLDPYPYPSVEGCEDVHHLCAYWAKESGCAQFPVYMNAACKKSCNKCGEKSVTNPTTAVSPENRCTAGGGTLIRYDAAYYCVLDECTSWYDTRDWCLQMGMNLVQPEDPIRFARYLGTPHGAPPYYCSGYLWLGAIGDSVNQVWVNGTVISNTDPSWYTSPNVNNGFCTAVGICWGAPLATYSCTGICEHHNRDPGRLCKDTSYTACPGLHCANGQCIGEFSICDGNVDCDDDSDELYCPCSGFQCRNGIQCLESSDLKCNGDNDCDDGSDEDYCRDYNDDYYDYKRT